MSIFEIPAAMIFLSQNLSQYSLPFILFFSIHIPSCYYLGQNSKLQKRYNCGLNSHFCVLLTSSLTIKKIITLFTQSNIADTYTVSSSIYYR